MIRILRQRLAFSLCLIQAAIMLVGAQPGLAASKWDSLKKAGDAAYEAADYAEAEAQFRAAVKEAEKFEETDKRRATTTYNLALVLQTEERFDEAQTTYGRAIDLLSKAYGPENERIGQVYEQLAELQKAKDSIKGAEENYQKALAIYEKAYGNEKPEMAVALDSVGDFYTEQEEFAKAEPLYRRALEISKATIGIDKPETGKRQAKFADFFCMQGKYAPAQPLYEAALKIADATAKDAADTGKLCFNYGGLYSDQGQFSLAEPLFKRAVAIGEHNAPKDVPLIEANLGYTLDMEQKFDEAEKVYVDALARLEKLEEPDDTTMLQCLKNYQKHFNLQKKKEDATKIAARIKELRARMAPVTPIILPLTNDGTPPEAHKDD